MSETELDQILGALMGGKYHCTAGSVSYTGDYTVYIIYYNRVKAQFVDERYDCHQEGGDRLFYEEPLSEAQVRKHFQSRDYARELRHLSDYRVF